VGLGEALLAWAEPVRDFLVFVGIRSERRKICCEDEDDVIIHSCHLFVVLNCVIFTVLSIFSEKNFSVEPAVGAILIS
jgi:hypothetical protein